MSTAQQLDINSHKSIFSMIYLVVVSVSVFIIQPGIVQAFVDDLSLTPEQAGYVASAEMWGMALSTILLIFFANRINWRTLSAVSLTVAVIGNLASVLDTNLYVFAAIRSITGLGLGVMITLPFAMLGMTEKTDFNYGTGNFCLLLYGAIVLYFIPSTLDIVGLDGIFIFLATFCGLGLLVVSNLPEGDNTTTEISKDGPVFSNSIKAITLLAILVFNIAIGAVWAYLFLVGLDANIDEQDVASILTFSQFLGMLGSLLVVFLSSKMTRSIPLTIAVLGCSLSVSLLLSDADYFTYSIAIYIFNFLWNIVQPYLFATLAAFNDQSATVVRGAGMQMIGFAVGPFLAATIVGSAESPSYYYVVLLGTVLFFISWLLLLPAISAQKKYRQFSIVTPQRE